MVFLDYFLCGLVFCAFGWCVIGIPLSLSYKKDKERLLKQIEEAKERKRIIEEEKKKSEGPLDEYV